MSSGKTVVLIIDRKIRVQGTNRLSSDGPVKLETGTVRSLGITRYLARLPLLVSLPLLLLTQRVTRTKGSRTE